MQNLNISQILDDLNRGLTRSPKTKGYNSELGSIKEKYNLSEKELAYIFKHPKLIGKRAKLPVFINLVDDTEVVEAQEEINYVNNAGVDPNIFDTSLQDSIKQAQDISRAALNNNNN